MSEASTYTSTVTTTTAPHALERKIASPYPVLLKAKALESRLLQSRVPYSIYVHHLNPQPNFGETGDLFYALQTRSVLWKDKTGWIEWEGIFKSERSRERNAQHPVYPKFLLFLSENTYATWQTEDGFRTSCNRLVKRLASESESTTKHTIPYVIKPASFFVDQLWERRNRYPEIFGTQDSPNRPTKRQRTNSQVFSAPSLDSLTFDSFLGLSKSTEYVNIYRGTRFPVDCPTASWGGSSVTILPYATSSDGQNIDMHPVQVMATYPNALITTHAHIKVITLPPNLSSQLLVRTQLIQDIRNALGSHESVLVKGWYCEDPISLANKDSLLYHARSEQARFKCKDARARADAVLQGEAPKSSLIDIGAFLNNVDTPTACQQISDFSAYTPQVPFFVRDLSDGFNATQITKHLSKISVPHDSWSSSTIMSHAGFLSYPNEQLSGSCTYIHVMEGRKAITTFFPDTKETQVPDLLSTPMTGPIQTIPAQTIWLEPGDTLLQPPLVYQSIYNAEDSICTKGSFEVFDTLQYKLRHASMLGLLNRTAEMDTVGSFDSDLRIIARMAMSIPYQPMSRTTPLAGMYALAVLTTKAEELCSHAQQNNLLSQNTLSETKLAREAISIWLQHAHIQTPVEMIQDLVINQNPELATQRIQVHPMSM